MTKISRAQYLAFVEHYYHNGNSASQRIGQAFLKLIDVNDAMGDDEVEYGTDDAVVLDLIEERYVKEAN